jgi:preprotein translocase subunit SecD
MIDDCEKIAFAVSACICLLIALTAPGLLQSSRIGLAFRGGSEILYVATRAQGSEAPSREDLLSTARELAHRAKASGVAEPDSGVEAPARIRVLPAGAGEKDEAQQLLRAAGYQREVGAVIRWSRRWARDL